MWDLNLRWSTIIQNYVIEHEDIYVQLSRVNDASDVVVNGQPFPHFSVSPCTRGMIAFSLDRS